jgi:hypothetical protein
MDREFPIHKAYIAVKISEMTVNMLPDAIMIALAESGHSRTSTPYMLLLMAKGVSEMTSCRNMTLHTNVSTTSFTFREFQESNREGLQK